MATVSPFGFGSGIVWAIQLNDVNGASITNPLVQRFLVQEFTLDLDAPQKELTALNTFPIAVARSSGKVTGKIKFANLNIGQLNATFFGEASSPVAGGANQIIPVNDELAVIPATPFQAPVANSASISAGNPMVDLGVRGGPLWANPGQYFTRVTSAPATGQYSVNLTTGVYTFAAADTLKNVLLDYSYSPNASLNQSIVMANHLLGAFPTLQLIGKTIYKGLNAINWSFQLNQVVGTKLAFSTKTTDFLYPELDFSAFADGAGNLGIFTGQNL